jgi:hypothetical protein
VTSASEKRRKARTLRDETVVDDTAVVLRAAAADRPRTLRNAVEDAVDSGATYVIVRSDGRREMLYGISVFAQREGTEVADVLRLFPHSPSFLGLTIGEIRRAGFEVLPTGSNPDHYDVQLIAGRIEGIDEDAGREEVRSAVARLLLAAGDLKANPAYAGGTSDHPEDER